MRQKKVKKYLKDHKYEIAFGVACVLIGLKIGKGRLTSNERDLIKTLRTMNTSNNKESLAEVINKMISNCTSAIPMMPDNRFDTRTAESLCEFIMHDDLKNRNLTGALLFAKK